MEDEPPEVWECMEDEPPAVWVCREDEPPEVQARAADEPPEAQVRAADALPEVLVDRAAALPLGDAGVQEGALLVELVDKGSMGMHEQPINFPIEEGEEAKLSPNDSSSSREI